MSRCAGGSNLTCPWEVDIRANTSRRRDEKREPAEYLSGDYSRFGVSNFNMHMNHLESYVTTGSWAPFPEIVCSQNLEQGLR